MKVKTEKSKNEKGTDFVIDFDLKIKRLFNNLTPYEGKWLGTPAIENYMEEIVRYHIRPEKVVLGKAKSKRYENSEDLIGAAIVLAYMDVLSLRLFHDATDPYWKVLYPKDTTAIDKWNKCLISCVKDPRVNPDTIGDLLIGSDAKLKFGEIYHYAKQAYDYVNGNQEMPTDENIVFESAPIKEEEVVVEVKAEEVVVEVKAEEVVVEVKAEEVVVEVLTDERILSKPEIKEEIVIVAEPVLDESEKEHPEEDIVLEEIVNKPLYGPKVEGYVIDQEARTFGEAMKNIITFDAIEFETNQLPSEPNTVISEVERSNDIFLKMYPQLSTFEELINGSKLHAVYARYVIPSGDLIMAYIYDTVSSHPISTLIIDPNVLYRNGYNVITTTCGDIIREATCPISESETIMLMIANAIDKKIAKKLYGKFPSGTKAVMEMVDLFGLGNREQLETPEWRKMILNIFTIIKSVPDVFKYRARIAEYTSPESFKLICDDEVLPLMIPGYGKDYTEITKPIGETGFTIHYNPEAYKPKRFEIEGSKVVEK